MQNSNPWSLDRSDDKIGFNVPSGRNVWVRSFHYSGTYDGVMAGLPSKARNDELLQSYVKMERRFPGDPQPLLIAPETRNGPRGSVWLPPFCCRASMISFPPADEEMHGSVLTVIWFCSPFFDVPLRNVITDALSRIDWERHAEDFCF